MEAAIPEGAVCRPNISPGAKRRRRNAALVFAGVAVATLGGMVAFGLPWYARLAVGLPVMVAVASYLQVVRHTCVARAADGTFESDDGTTTSMEEADVAASRKVAAGIKRDGVLAGLAVALLAAATGLVG